MGDRGSIAIRYNDGTAGEFASIIYFYTHWEGTELPETLAGALNSPQGRARWRDEQYLARIIFDSLTGMSGGETGYGIAPYPQGDLEHPILLVSPDSGMIERHPKEGVGQAPEASWTFREFVDLVLTGKYQEAS